MATIYMRDGAHYAGDVDEHGLPHGRGELNYSNGDRFDGWFSHGEISTGNATMRFANGTVLEGYYGHFGFSGDVRIRYRNGDRYDGSYSSDYGAPHGFGTMRYASGGTFDGEFYDGSPKSGKYYYDNGDTFEGKIYSDGTMDGKWDFRDGSVYVGKMRDGKPDGDGDYTPAYGSGGYAPRATASRKSAYTETSTVKRTPQASRISSIWIFAVIGAMGLDILLTFLLKDVSSMFRWVWLPLIGLGCCIVQTLIVGELSSGIQSVHRVLCYIWGFVRGDVVVVAYFAASKGWGILGAIFLFMFVFVLNAISYWIAPQMDS